MNRFLHGVFRAVVESFPLPEPILEAGSYQVAGQEALADLRAYFPGKEYLGIDTRPGPGVDRIADVEALPFADASMGTVIAMNTFEHVAHFWKGFEEIRRVLRPDGAFFLCSPFYFHIHDFPNDYWRFTPSALEVLLKDYPNRILGWQGPKRRPAAVWALALGPGQPAFAPEVYSAYRERIHRYAHQPLDWQKRVRYRVGRLLFGSRPFAPYLEQERWETTCPTASLA
ncbi:MAG TPA: class I SAM-dependent methyltransferase [Gemmataceae bacterium]|jgi:SAM-dependent methyltransferase|nr:class I SAM-dependent methyltransferase [Gemmataceae bacterium]